MKKYILFIFAALFYSGLAARYNTITVGAGYVFANIDDAETSASGWRIGGTYEFHPANGNVTHGFTISRLSVSAKVEEISGGQRIESKYSIGTWPFYYQPKIIFGDGSLQGFGKGAIGMQFSTVKIKVGSNDEFVSTDAGLYAGLGAGLTKEFSYKISGILEYEWAYLSNSYYRDGFLHSFTAGVTLRLD